VQWDELDPLNHYDVLTPTTAPDPGPESKGKNGDDMRAAFQRVKELADWRYVFTHFRLPYLFFFFAHPRSHTFRTSIYT
jgi:hypothetical protein